MKTTRLLPRPGTPIGWLPSGKPVYPVIGAASDEFDVEPDDEETEEEEESDDKSDDDSADGGKDKYTPPSRTEWLKVQASLAKANAQAKTRREALAEREKELQALRDEKARNEAEAERQAILSEAASGKGGKKKAAAPTTPVLPEGVLTKTQVRQLTAQAAREAEERAADKYRGQVVNMAARAALKEAGAAGNVSRLVNLLNLEEVQIDDEGEVTDGMDEQIERLKSELPQLFQPATPEKPKPRRAPAPRVQASGRQEVEELPRTSADRMAAAILGSR